MRQRQAVQVLGVVGGVLLWAWPAAANSGGEFMAPIGSFLVSCINIFYAVGAVGTVGSLAVLLIDLFGRSHNIGHVIAGGAGAIIGAVLLFRVIPAITEFGVAAAMTLR